MKRNWGSILLVVTWLASSLATVGIMAVPALTPSPAPQCIAATLASEARLSELIRSQGIRTRAHIMRLEIALAAANGAARKREAAAAGVWRTATARAGR
jgi:hypothetical protein